MVNKIPFFLENSNSLEGFLVWTNYDILSHSIADIIWQNIYISAHLQFRKDTVIMAFDGIVVADLVHEFRKELLNGRIAKIAQPESDELLLTIKASDGQKRLLISADASLPLIYLTDSNKPAPMTAPNFCMLLRKHIGGGRIVDIRQPKLERIIHFTIEHLDEMGDLCRKELIVEIMGKHSNIIFCTEGGKIIDSIKHVSAQMSSVREVLPGREYFIPDTMHKADPLTVDKVPESARSRQKRSASSQAWIHLFLRRNIRMISCFICIPSFRSTLLV